MTWSQINLVSLITIYFINGRTTSIYEYHIHFYHAYSLITLHIINNSSNLVNHINPNMTDDSTRSPNFLMYSRVAYIYVRSRAKYLQFRTTTSKFNALRKPLMQQKYYFIHEM